MNEPPPDLLKQIREAERKAAISEQRYKDEARKRAQAEAELGDMASTLDAMMASQTPQNVERLHAFTSQPRGHATAVICANDWHAEETIEPGSIDGANEFDLTIAKARVDRLWQKSLHLLEFARHLSDIKDLVVWLGGDLLNGVIHEELEESNGLGPEEARLWILERSVEGLELLKSETKLPIRVVTSYGNHGRTTKKTRISTGYKHNMEWGVYENLARVYANDPRIAVKVEPGYHNWLNIQGHDVRFHHGDAVKFGGGVGGVTIPLRKKIAQWNKRRHARLDVLGHFHQYLDDWNYVVCGCLVGYNAYAQHIGAEFQDPTQTFMVIDRARAKVMTLPVYVEEH